eukprot:Amastigsp_a176313_21.p2 type:complete len:339 gc:universal Amastigsp_a176313_21:31-1047(+)
MAASSDSPRVNILVLDGDKGHDWVRIFSDRALSDGTRFRVVQASWMNISVVSYPDSGPMVTCAPLRETDGVENDLGSTRNTVTFKPHFCIVRNQARGPTPPSDNRDQLFALMHAGVPSINSLESIYMCLERPVMFGALRRIARAHPDFQVVPQTFYANPKQMIIAPEPWPVVLKVSHAHAGMGKILVENSTAFRDMSTVLAVTGTHCSAEPFVDSDCGIRIQRIEGVRGAPAHYRVLEKTFTGSGWKSQFGGAMLTNTEPCERHRRWVDLAAAAFPGLDICALDIMRKRGSDGHAGEEIIIELNDTACGFLDWEEDTVHVVALAIDRLEQIYVERVRV